MKRKSHWMLVFITLLSGLVSTNSQATIDKTGDILIFISFSMPDENIKSWLIEANTIGASVILRGLIDNNWLKTLARTNSLLKDDNRGGVQIDPELFQDFNITQVPAVVIVAPSSTPCRTQTTCNSYGRFDVITGNISMRYALEKLQADGDISQETARAALAKLDIGLRR